MTPALRGEGLLFGIMHCVLAPRMFASGMLFVLGSADALSLCVLLAHIGAFFGVAEVLVSAEVVNLGVEIGPHDNVGGAVRLGERLAGKLACCGRQPSSGRSRSWLLGRCGGAGRRRGRRLGGGRCRGGCGWGCSYAAGAALIDIRLLGDAGRLVRNLVGAPFLLACFSGLLLCKRRARKSQGAGHCHTHHGKNLLSHVITSCAWVILTTPQATRSDLRILSAPHTFTRAVADKRARHPFRSLPPPQWDSATRASASRRGD